MRRRNYFCVGLGILDGKIRRLYQNIGEVHDEFVTTSFRNCINFQSPPAATPAQYVYPLPMTSEYPTAEMFAHYQPDMIEAAAQAEVRTRRVLFTEVQTGILQVKCDIQRR